MKRYEPTKHQYIFKRLPIGVYYFRGTVEGIFIERSLKTDSITLAKDRADQLRKAPQRESKKRHTFDDAFDLVIKIQSTKADNTLDQTTTQINKHLRPWFREKCPFLDQFEKNFEEKWADYKIDQAQKKTEETFKRIEQIQTQITQIQNVKRKEKLRARIIRLQESIQLPRKLAHDRRYLLMTLIRAFNKGWIRREFQESDFELNDSGDPIGKYLDDNQVQAILNEAISHEKFYLQVSLAVLMAMRRSEILHLKKEEIDLFKREIDLNPKRVKTRQRREVPIPIPDRIFPLLKKFYLAAEGEYLFPAWHTNQTGKPLDYNTPQDDNRYHWDKIRKKTGIEARFHDLRHTAITNMLKAGVPDIAVRKICGVSEATMRRVYAHIEKDMKNQFRDVFKDKFCAEFVQKGEIHDETRNIEA